MSWCMTARSQGCPEQRPDQPKAGSPGVGGVMVGSAAMPRKATVCLAGEPLPSVEIQWHMNCPLICFCFFFPQPGLVFQKATAFL